MKVIDFEPFQTVYELMNIPYIDPGTCKYLTLLNYGERTVLSTYETKDANELAVFLKGLYGSKWERLFDMYHSKYDPITNTDFTETETIKDLHVTNDTTKYSEDTANKDDSTTNSTGTNTNNTTGRNKVVNDGSNTSNTTGTTGNCDNEEVYSFDGGMSPSRKLTSNGTNTSNVVGSNTATQNTEVSTTDTTNMNNELVVNDTRTENKTGSNNRDTNFSQDYTRELHKVGNIGVTTPAEMLTKELEFWKWNYFETVVNDVMSVTTLKIF